MRAGVGWAIGVVVLAAAISAHWRRSQVLPQADIQGGILDLSEEAVRLAGDSGTVLDYSVESVQQVENALGGLYDQKLPLEQRRYLAVRYGAYVGEVIRRKWGGEWGRDHAVAGPGSFPIKSQGHESFPIGWCFKRLSNGPEDNVWHKLQFLYMRESLPTGVAITPKQQ